VTGKKKTRKDTEAAVEAPPDPREALPQTPASWNLVLAEVRKVIADVPPPPEPKAGDLFEAMLHAYFADGLPCGYGQEARHRIATSYVDRNEFRVTDAFEVEDLLGDLPIPGLFDRCLWVRESVAQIYNDQNAVSLDFLREAGIGDRNNFFQRTPALRPHVVAFLGNLSLLMTTGEVHGDTYLKSLSFFGHDPEPQVVSSTIEALGGVRTAFVPDSLKDLFAVYVRRTLSPALERVGYDKKPGEDETVSAMRADLLTWLARRGQDAKATAFAESAAARYLADSTSVDPGIADAVVSLAARKGDAVMFADYQRRLESTDVPAIRRRFLSALGAFEDPALTAKALDYMLSDKVRPTETFVIMQGLGGRDEATAQRMFQWMTSHYEQLATRVPPPALRFMPMMGSGCSAERLAATQAFFGDPKRATPGMEKTLERVSDNVHNCISLREREGERVTTFMRGFAIN